jgi:transposase-like protein
VTVGTIFQDTRTPLPVWFRAVWYVTSQKTGTSASSIQRILGLRSYQTAWTWLHKLRRAMVRPSRDKLRGRVEVDETFVGGEDHKAGVWVYQKAVVIVAAEEDGRGIGRIRLASVTAPTKSTLHRFAQASIEPGSVIHTDGFSSWRGLGALGYKHERTVLVKKDKKAASRLLPRVHRVASLLKRWLLGTHQGAVEPEHLDYYLDEFAFRFNRRTSRSRGKLFYRLLQQAVEIPPTTYRQMIGGKDPDD